MGMAARGGASKRMMAMETASYCTEFDLRKAGYGDHAHMPKSANIAVFPVRWSQMLGTNEVPTRFQHSRLGEQMWA